MENFKIGQLTKEMVVARLKKIEDPCVAAAQLVKKALAVVFKDKSPDDPTVATVIQDACHGGMTALLLAKQNLAKGSVLMLQVVSEVTLEAGLEPMRTMQSALLGIAELHQVVSSEQMEEIRREISAHYTGAGEIFSALLIRVVGQKARTLTPS